MQIDRQLEDAYRTLATRRNVVAPSHAARHVGGSLWRGLQRPATQAAERLVDSGDFEYARVSGAAPRSIRLVQR